MFEILSVFGLLGAVGGWAVLHLVRGKAARGVALVTLLACAATALWFGKDLQREEPREAAVTDRPIVAGSEEWSSADSCRSCHPHHYHTWHDSYHRTMTQRAGPDSIVGDFAAPPLQRFGRPYFVGRKGDEFWVRFPDPDHKGMGDAPMIERRIVLVTGSHHMQVYWYATGVKRALGQFPFVWLIAERRWIPRNAAFLQPYEEHPQSETGRWNDSCIQCHATGGQPHLDDIDTRVASFGISCEACHGPGAAHTCSNRNPARRYAHHVAADGDDTIVNPERLPHERRSQVCGQCHAMFTYELPQHQQFISTGFTYRAGDDLTTTRQVRPSKKYPKWLWADPNRFWSDGMVRVSGREYNGLVGSPCYQRGTLSCMSCHSMHRTADDKRPRDEWADDQLHPGMDGDTACTQCHTAYRDPARVAAHTHHGAGSPGQSCMNCHMPHTTYGLLKAIRSHQISSPSATESVDVGRPNACNQCHLDRTLAWTARHLKEWYDLDEPPLTKDQQTIAASILWTFEGDAAQRALMAWSFGWPAAHEASGTEWMAPYLAELMMDPYEAVRFIAERSLRRVGFADLQYDFVGSVESRKAAIDPVLQAWRSTAPRIDRPTLLLKRGGTVDAASRKRLLKRRDKRPVALSE